MAYPVSESFDTTVPPTFATPGGSGSVSVAYNSAQKSADLTFAQNQSFWRLTDVAPTTDFWCEFDLELVSISYTYSHYGIWISSASGWEGFRLCVHNTTYVISEWTSGGSELNGQSVLGPTFPVGNRRVWRVDAKRNSTGTWIVYLSINGVVVQAYQCLNPRTWSLFPGVFGYGCVVRVHSVTGNLTSAIPAMPTIANHGLPKMYGSRSNGPQGLQSTFARHGLPKLYGNRSLGDQSAGAAASRGFLKAMGRYNAYYNGKYRLVGYTRQQGNPVSRKVRLYDKRSGLLVQETFSDASGAFEFKNIDNTLDYFFTAHDHTGAFNATIKDVKIVPIL